MHYFKKIKYIYLFTYIIYTRNVSILAMSIHNVLKTPSTTECLTL